MDPGKHTDQPFIYLIKLAMIETKNHSDWTVLTSKVDSPLKAGLSEVSL